MIFLTLFGIPLLFIFAHLILGGKKVTFREFLLQMGVQAIIAGISCGVVYWSNTDDTEIHNGRVASKTRDKVPCGHSYKCFCHDVCSGSGKDRSCHEVCQTCYHHSYDIDWNVRTTNGERFNIARVDWQGLTEPPRWTSTVIGEPTAVPHSYTNYVKASPDTLFRKQGLTEKYAGQLPAYPLGVYDLWKLDRIVQVGTSLPDTHLWNSRLSEINADLGRGKQVNAIVVLTKDKPREYFHALEQAWIGGKKNDVVVVISASSDTIQWIDVMAWTDKTLFKVKLRDDILDIGTLDRDKILGAVRQNIHQHYVRKSMSDFEYLKSSIQPTTTQWVVSLIIGFLVCLGTSLFVHQNDVFGEEGSRWGYY